MNNKKLVVIGGDAAGMTAASKVRREQSEREIVVFERGNHTSYAACGMPYYIGGQVDSEESLIARKPEVFREKQNIDVRIRHEVIEIDVENKRVKVKNLDQEKEFWETWDDLLIATGASPIVPKMENIDAGGIVGFNGAAKRIDTIATAITAGMTAQQLIDLDLAYAPPFSNVWDPVQIAARKFV